MLTGGGSTERPEPLRQADPHCLEGWCAPYLRIAESARKSRPRRPAPAAHFLLFCCSDAPSAPTRFINLPKEIDHEIPAHDAARAQPRRSPPFLRGAARNEGSAPRGGEKKQVHAVVPLRAGGGGGGKAQHEKARPRPADAGADL